MIGTEHLQTIVGSNAVDNDGDKLGKVGNVYLDDRPASPEWATVNTGLFGTKESFVPLRDATRRGRPAASCPTTRPRSRTPRKVADDGHIGDDEQEELYRYYGSRRHGAATPTAPRATPVRTDAGTSGVGTDRTAPGVGYVERTTAGTVGHDTSGPTTDDAMTRSEEQLHVGTETGEAGRARLRKYVVTEQETVTVPVTARRSGSSASRSPTPTVGEALAARRSPRRSTRSCCTRSAPWWRRRPSRSSASASTRRRSPSRRQVTEEVRKEQIDTDGDGIADRR